MSLPSGMPSRKRMTIRSQMPVEKPWAAARTMNRTMVRMKTRLRPSRSATRPPSRAPTSAPPCTAAVARPSSTAVGLYSVLMKIKRNEIAYRSQASMRIVAIIIQPPRLLDVVPGLFSSRTVAWSASSRSLDWSTVPSRSSVCHELEVTTAGLRHPDRRDQGDQHDRHHVDHHTDPSREQLHQHA